MGLVKDEIRVRLTFTEPILGSSSGNKDLHRDFIASKGPDAKTREEEVAALGEDEVEHKEMTVFPRTEDGRPMFWDYQIRGFFKSACKALNANDPGHKLAAYKTKIDTLVFVKERRIPINGTVTASPLQRPLRAETAQGPRVALASSEEIEAGATCEFTIQLLADGFKQRVLDWLEYGQFVGMGQWRGGSFGRFTYEVIK